MYARWKRRELRKVFDRVSRAKYRDRINTERSLKCVHPPRYALGTENRRCSFFGACLRETRLRRNWVTLICRLIYDLQFLFFHHGLHLTYLSSYTVATPPASFALPLDSPVSSRALFPFCFQLWRQTMRQKIMKLELRSRTNDTNELSLVQTGTPFAFRCWRTVRLRSKRRSNDTALFQMVKWYQRSRNE